MNTPGHVVVVRTLYRRLLKLHRKLPLSIRALGDQYLKDEFRRHKNVTSEQADDFMQEWKIYGDMLEQQINSQQMVGSDLAIDQVESMTEEQLGQLYSLQQEATKPSTPQEGTDNYAN